MQLITSNSHKKTLAGWQQRAAGERGEESRGEERRGREWRTAATQGLHSGNGPHVLWHTLDCALSDNPEDDAAENLADS